MASGPGTAPWSSRAGTESAACTTCTERCISFAVASLRGNTRGVSQSREALSEAVRSQIEQGNHPLIVAEGASEKKIERIRESPYLNACFTELGATASRLVTLGVSFSEQDEHVAEAIAENTGIRTVFVGVHGGLDSADGTALVARVKRLSERRGQLHPKKPLHLHYFDSATAKVWG